VTSHLTVEGNLTSDPRLNYTSTGKAVANLRIAVSARRKDRSGEYADTPPVFYDVTLWGQPAENVAESLHVGDRVIVTGTTYLDSYTDSTGDQRVRTVLDADAIGVSLRYATATPVKTSRRQTGDPEPADRT
jgi:single-strand DNA-binding protein